MMGIKAGIAVCAVAVVRGNSYKTITPEENHGLCLDAPGGSAWNGNYLWLWECNGMDSQHWVFDNYQIRYGGDENYCIDAGDMSNGNQLMLWECNGYPQQTWGYDSDALRAYISGTSTCLDLWEDQQWNGSPVHVWECNAQYNQQWDLWDAPDPSPDPSPSPVPSPPSPPSPPGPSDVNLQWETGHHHGACNGPAIQGDDVAQILDNNGIRISTNAAPAGGCVYRVGSPSIDLDAHPHLEADIETSGNTEAYGKEAGQWFSFWMYPPGYAYANGDGESGEVDFVENIPHVRTNFAGCSHDCHETEWGQASNAVRGHVTMHYDRSAQRINVYRCDFGSETCSTNGEVAYVDLTKMTVNKPYTYTLCTDVWYAKPGMDFSITVTNLRILSAESFGKYLNSSVPFMI